MNNYIVTTLSILLAAIYIVFGLNYFIGFLTMPPMEGTAGQFIGAMFVSKFLLLIKSMEILFGLMILFNFYRRLALVLISPISIGILLFHSLVADQPVMAMIIVLINVTLLWAYRNDYAGVLKLK